MRYGEFIHMNVVSAMMGVGIFVLFGVIGLLIVLSTLLLWGILNYHKEVKE